MSWIYGWADIECFAWSKILSFALRLASTLNAGLSTIGALWLVEANCWLFWIIKNLCCWIGWTGVIKGANWTDRRIIFVCGVGLTVPLTFIFVNGRELAKLLVGWIFWMRFSRLFPKFIWLTLELDSAALFWIELSLIRFFFYWGSKWTLELCIACEFYTCLITYGAVAWIWIGTEMKLDVLTCCCIKFLLLLKGKLLLF